MCYTVLYVRMQAYSTVYHYYCLVLLGPDTSVDLCATASTYVYHEYEYCIVGMCIVSTAVQGPVLYNTYCITVLVPAVC